MDNCQTIEFTQEEESSLSLFCNDSLRKISGLYICWLFFSLCISSLIYFFTKNSGAEAILPSIFIYYFIFFMHLIFRLKKGFWMNILSPEILILILYTLFHLGFVTLYGTGLFPIDNDVFYYENSIPKALFAINIGLIGFIFGFEIAGGRGFNSLGTNVKIPSVKWCFFGICCMTLALIMHVGVISYLSLGFFQAHGYAAIQDIEKYTGSAFLASIFQHALHLMILGLVVYTVSSALRYGKIFKSKIAMVLTITYITLIIFEGDRGPIVQLGIPLLLVRHYFVKFIKIRYIIVLFVGLLFLFAAISVVRTIALDPSKMLQEYKYQKSAGNVTWMNPFIEMGSSFVVVDITVHEVPDSVPYWKGASWRDAIYHIIPFFQGFALRQGWTAETPSDWVTFNYFGLDASGRAFTVAAEGYLNFGYAGVFFELMITGAYIRWLTKKFSKNISAMWGIVMLVSMAGVVMLIRNHFGIVINILVQIIIITGLLNILLGNESNVFIETKSNIEGI